MAFPCICGCSLHLSTLLIAIVEMSLAGLAAIAVTILGSMYIKNAIEFSPVDLRESAAAYSYGIFVAAFLVCIGQFLLGAMLKDGRDQRDRKKCRIWLTVTLILFGMGLVSFVASLLFGNFHFASVAGVSRVIFPIVGFAYRIFAMLVVYEYVQEMDRGSDMESLTATESRAELNGCC